MPWKSSKSMQPSEKCLCLKTAELQVRTEDLVAFLPGPFPFFPFFSTPTNQGHPQLILHGGPVTVALALQTSYQRGLQRAKIPHPGVLAM